MQVNWILIWNEPTFSSVPWCPNTTHYVLFSAMISAAAATPMAMQVAEVGPEGILGKTLASTTLRLRTPLTRKWMSTTDMFSSSSHLSPSQPSLSSLLGGGCGLILHWLISPSILASSPPFFSARMVSGVSIAQDPQAWKYVVTYDLQYEMKLLLISVFPNSGPGRISKHHTGCGFFVWNPEKSSQRLLTPRAVAEEDDEMGEAEHIGADTTSSLVEADSECVQPSEGRSEGGCRGWPVSSFLAVFIAWYIAVTSLSSLSRPWSIRKGTRIKIWDYQQKSVR